jgi:uncharacterized protein (TIGR02145 family)
MARILFLMMLPFVCFSQITPSEDIPVNNLLKEKENLDTKRKASYNLDEIKVRWKKAALENCTGVPCVVTPPAPSFTCGTSTVKDGDGNDYQTIGIGTQCWTKSNLKATKYNDGVTPIPEVAVNFNSETKGSRAVYAGESGYLGTYGYLYNWYAVGGITLSGGVSDPTKNICPVGWRVPSTGDLAVLTNFLGSDPGTQLKENSTLWTTNTGTNTSGFSALPGGAIFSSSFNIRFSAYFWLSDNISGNGINFRLAYNNATITIDNVVFGRGASIRCLKDGI